MKFMRILLDLIPVDPTFEQEAIENGPEVSSILLVAGAVCMAVALVVTVVKNNKK